MVLLSACSGGGTASPANQAEQTAGAQKATARFVITVPPKPQSGARAPQYISPSTQSLTITIDTQTPIVTGVTPASPNCSGSGAALVCTVTIPVAPGTHTFAFTTFDGPDAGGNKLSTTTLTGQLIVADQVNTVPVTLSGIPASVVLTLAQLQPPFGSAATIPLTVAAKDVDGNTIIGAAPYVNAGGSPLTISISDSDTSGATALSTTTVTSPATGVNVTYTGATIASATFSASAAGIAQANITNATLTPGGSSVSSGGAVAIAVVTIGATTYAFVPTPVGLGQVRVASSGTIEGFKRRPAGRSAHSTSQPPPGLGQQQLEAWWAAYIAAERNASLHAGQNASAPLGATPAPTRSPIPIDPVPNECAANVSPAGATLYCINFFDTQGRVDVVSVDSSGASTLLTQYAAGIGSREVTNSGAPCYICGVVYDSADNAIIIATAKGYQLYSTAAPYALLKTIPANVSENFGYDIATNQIWSPQYSGAQSPTGIGCKDPSLGCSLDLIDVASSSLYTFAVPSPSPSSTAPAVFIEAPDAGAVDPTTGIAVAPEENSRPSCPLPGMSPTGAFPFYLMSLPNAQLGVPAPGPTGVTTFPGQQYFSDAAFTQVMIPNDLPGACYQISDVAVDTPDHLVFFAGEFSSPGGIGVGQLPAAPTNTPALGDYAFASLPAMPNAAAFNVPGDPHAVATATIGAKTYGIAFDASMSYLVVIDLKSLLQAPRAPADPHLVDTSYDLQANGVITYVGIPGS